MMIPQAKLTRDALGTAMGFGHGVALSDDGDCALVGGTATWIFSRRFGSWAEEAKFPHAGGMCLARNVRTAFIGDSSRIYVARHSGGVWADSTTLQCGGATSPYSSGTTFAISRDRSTLLVGAPLDNNTKGAAWVFVRDENGVWTEQKKLTGFNEIGAGAFGWSVALSDDGDNALIGGLYDNDHKGAVWTFTRDASEWHPLSKLVLPRDTGEGYFGYAVALSANGRRALIGGSGVRTYVRTLSGWQQDGDKLPVGGGSVGLSADGTTALIGDASADGGVGAAWLWLLAGALYKLTATDEVGHGYFGYRVALTPDGNTALIGGFADNLGRGAAWVFVNPLSVTRLTPSTGPASGGTTVVISGTGFSGATGVRFGAVPAASFTVDGATQITAVSPPGQPGVVDVRVTTSAATSETVVTSKYTYV